MCVCVCECVCVCVCVDSLFGAGKAIVGSIVKTLC